MLAVNFIGRWDISSYESCTKGIDIEWFKPDRDAGLKVRNELNADKKIK
jgi:hypothetical protein